MEQSGNACSENADNEPATFIKEDGSYYMFYSSDYHEPGRSYNGASAHVAKFDSSMNPVSTDELITIPSLTEFFFMRRRKGESGSAAFRI